MEFKNKIVYIISHEEWGDMLMSKHHYAIELGKMNNKVYFINHPDRRHRLKRGEIKIEKTKYENVYSVSNRLFHPYFFKYKYNGLYNFLTHFHIKKIVKKIAELPDVIWSFEIGNALPIKSFPGKLKIYMPVDMGEIDIVKVTETADVIISVTPEILDVYKNINIPKFSINHGVASVFLNNTVFSDISNPIRIGYSGSLVRNDLDIKTFLLIIQKHSDKIFEFWGENNPNKSNIHLPQDVSNETLEFLKVLKNFPNVILHGAVNSTDLSEGLKRMSALLICYDIKNDQNHHKVLEYLGTGKVIISSYMSSYSNNCSGMIEMVTNKENNDELPNLFDTVINDLPYYNSESRQMKRIDFAKKHSYLNQILTIQNYLNQL